LLATQERRCRNGQIRLMERRERREVVVAELVDALGGGQVLEPVLAEVAEAVRAVKERGGRGRDEHLTAVAAGGDAGRAVNVSADVALLSEMRRTGVEAHAHPDRAGREALERLPRRGERTRRGREGDEERVSLRVDLNPAVGAERAPHDPAVLGERLRVALSAELVQELGRTLHVGEEERDCSGRKIAPHDAVMMRHEPEGVAGVYGAGTVKADGTLAPLARRRARGFRVLGAVAGDEQPAVGALEAGALRVRREQVRAERLAAMRAEHGSGFRRHVGDRSSVRRRDGSS
jgi:hypothetical protein